MCVLKTYLVEDSFIIRENLIATLQELGPVQVIGSAEDEATAVKWLRHEANQCDLVIVDIFLKTGTGLGVINSSKALAQQHKLVVLSNYATPAMRAKCLALGADQVFDKSNEIDLLLLYCAKLVAEGAGGNPTGDY
jgi:DNA-binding NarL/FixJ family response regulator